MIYLQKGDYLPIVAIVQLLLNRALRPDGGIMVDGAFGPRTKEAVQQFQVRQGLNPNGIINSLTWRRLNAKNYQIIDSVDATENVDEHGRMRLDTDRHWEGETTDIRNEGGEPVVHYGMSRGGRHVLQSVMARAELGNVMLLRFHGHGSPGNQALSSGKMDGTEFMTEHMSHEGSRTSIRQLRSIFSPYASVQLMGCRVGRGERGYRLLQGLAELWGVPISAGTNTQYGGGGSTFVFEGPIRTAFPNGLSLRHWAAQLPDANVSY